MEVIVIFAIIYILFVVLELVPIFKSKNYKVFAIYAVIIIISYSIGFATNIGIDVPSINNGIIKLVHYILG